ncbi:MAG: hypothetical protein J0I42_13410 [Bosea sp.]|uniref:hypothetical protein n=1 Tax=Bosea sp. (in: a-proteobacteria) TaxID=1871050 RepID=UPI001ACBD78B|nr:hypothetical protein [Bosea sp. (in: a-proteobacteria)]MBN9452940.1 hypothetical protein [Bosea sp. (in: a-proteobacteria)]
MNEQQFKQAYLAMEKAFDSLQGRIAAMEFVSTQLLLTLAEAQPEPFEFMQQFTNAVRESSRNAKSEEPGHASGQQAVDDMQDALDVYLAQLIANAGQLRRG